MQVDDFIDDLNELMFRLEAEFEESHPGELFNLERIPYVQFLEHYKEKPEWKPHVSNINSPFMRLLQLENLFFVKTIVAEELAKPKQKNQWKNSDKASSISGASKVSPVKSVNFLRDSSAIRAVAVDGSTQTVQISVDVSTLKIFALLMCRGTVKSKAKMFYHTVIGMERLKKEKAKASTLDALELFDSDSAVNISWNSKKLVNSFKKLIFFSEIFPKKYQSEFMEELMKH